MLENVITAFERYLTPDFVFSGEMHDFWEMMYVIEGRVCVSADERIYDLNENEVIFHRPMEFHKFNAMGNAKIFVASFTLSGDMASKLECSSFKLSLNQKSMILDIIGVLKSSGAGVNDYYNDFIGSLVTDTRLRQQFATMLELFFLSLLQESIPVTDLPLNFETELFKRTVLLMDDNLSGWITADEIAQRLNISVSYLKKIFAKYAGLGIHKYFVKSKINLATKLLKTGKSVSDVSEELNFSSHNYFCSVFKRETGRLPSELKAEAANKTII